MFWDVLAVPSDFGPEQIQVEQIWAASAFALGLLTGFLVAPKPLFLVLSFALMILGFVLSLIALANPTAIVLFTPGRVIFAAALAFFTCEGAKSLNSRG